MPALVQVVEVRECIQAGAVSFVQGPLFKSQFKEGRDGGAVAIKGLCVLGIRLVPKLIK